MCTRTPARSVAPMRLSLLRLAAAAGAAAALTAAPRADAADAVYGGGSSTGDPIVVRADPAAKQLRSIGISWRAACADGMGVPRVLAAHAQRARGGLQPRR